jgi:hypothetical protein
MTPHCHDQQLSPEKVGTRSLESTHGASTATTQMAPTRPQLPALSHGHHISTGVLKGTSHGQTIAPAQNHLAACSTTGLRRGQKTQAPFAEHTFANASPW